jgi:hypothetical protein
VHITDFCFIEAELTTAIAQKSRVLEEILASTIPAAYSFQKI